ncbi:EAL domain-containing protein [Erwinia sp. Leaf53]|uniref:EAL domain-containing protein n=1 Tax=Erwinia sp. Leaf53 TaxID=1736225 RepID=UPI00092E724E|nr:EAL domain-containing protein [Erwinia sp. Leaf53]
MNVKPDNEQFVLEPIYTQTGNLFAFELLTHVDLARGNDALSDGHGTPLFPASARQRIALFEEQLETVDRLTRGSLLPPLISVNVDADIAEHVLSSSDVTRRTSTLGRLRFEISEEYSHLNTPGGEKMLQRLSRHCPLWLDHFGAGNSSLVTVINGNFEYVKINKNFFWRYGESHTFGNIIEHVIPYCKGVIVDGVENNQFKEILLPFDISGVQGFVWEPGNIPVLAAS